MKNVKNKTQEYQYSDISAKINEKSSVMPGVYTYYIEVRNIYDEIYKYEGTLRLLR